jgi:hypothetical protein
MAMKNMLWLAILVGATVQAAEPPAKPGPAVTRQPAAVRPPLDLRIGDVRRYMLPDEYRANLTGREEERNTVVVEARVPLLPLESEQPMPPGLAGLWHSVKHPSQAWRLFVPELRAPPAGPPQTKVPPPFSAGSSRPGS